MNNPQIRIRASFIDAAQALDSRDCARVWETTKQLGSSPEAKGIRKHNVGDFVSLSASMDLRILAVREPLYRCADLVIDTEGQSERSSLTCLVSSLGEAGWRPIPSGQG